MRLLSAGDGENKTALRGLLVSVQKRLAEYPNLRVRDDFADALVALGVDFRADLEPAVAAALSDEFFGRRVRAMSVAELGAASGLLSQLLLAQAEDQCAGAFRALQDVLVLGYREQLDGAAAVCAVFGLVGPDDAAARRLVKQALALALRLKGFAERDMRPAAQFIANRLKEFSGDSGLFAWAAGELQDLRARVQRADD